MPSRTSGLFFFVLFASTLASCMFFRSLGELSQDARDGRADADSRADALAEADAPPVDGGADAPLAIDSAGSDANRPSPCGIAHTLCSDFDVGDILAGGWASVDHHPTIGSIELVTANFASPPRALRAVHPRRAAAAGDVRNVIDQTWSGAFTRARMELDVYVNARPTDAGSFGVGLVLILFRSDSGDTGTVLSISEAVPYLSVESTGAREYFDVPPLPDGRWAHVSLDFSRGGSLSYTLDGQTGSRSFAPVTMAANPRVSISIGLHSFSGDAPPVAVDLDNVTVDLE